MPSGFSNQPRILRGAFVEFGISLPPLIVVFQFNPLTISRTRTASIDPPRTPRSRGAQNMSLLEKAATADSLTDVRGKQIVKVGDETLSFDIRLDATDKLDEGDTLTEQFGVAPQLSTLELMMVPKGQGLLGAAASMLLGGAGASFSFVDDAKNPPVILFIWGRKKVMPVNITSMQIKEEEFSTDLNPTRATVSVNLQVIEGPNAPFLYTKAMKEAMSLTNLANIGDIANTIIPA
jgi:Contractile injection system tube protein